MIKKNKKTYTQTNPLSENINTELFPFQIKNTKR